MVSIRELCEEFRKVHEINTTAADQHCKNIEFTGIIDITPNEPQLICIGSRPGMGRSALCLDLILKTALTTQKTVLFFLCGTTFENNMGLLIDRLLRRLCGVNKYSIVKNADSETLCNNTKKVPSALKLLEKLNIYIDTYKYPTYNYINDCVSNYNNVGLVVVGNVEYAVPDNENKVEKGCAIKAFIDQLSILTKEINTSIIMITTLTRCIEYRKNKRPLIRDLKTIRLQRLSDTIVLLYRDAYYTLNEEDNSAKILLAKNKNGNTGWIKMRFDYNTLNFTK